MSAWEEKHAMGKVLYDFKANGQFQIDLQAGEMVEVLKQSSGWFRGRIVGRDSKGIFPISFVQIMPDEPFPGAATAAATPAVTASVPPPRPMLSPSAAASPAAASQAAAPAAASSVANNPFKRAEQAATEGSVAATLPAKAAAPTPAPAAAAAPATPVRQFPPPPPASASASVGSPLPPPGRGGGAPPPLPSPATPGVSRPPPPLLQSPSNSQQQQVSLSSPSSSVVGRAASGTTVGAEPMEPEQKLQANMSLESLLAEVDHTVREWSALMRSSLSLGNSDEYHRGMERLSSLLESRRRLMVAGSGSDESSRAAIRHEIIEVIEGSRKMAEGYMVPRNAAGAVADSNNTGVVELLALHRSMYSALKEESAAVWIAKGHERRVASFRKQEIEQARSNQQAAMAQGATQGGGAGGAAAGGAGGAGSQVPPSPSASSHAHTHSMSSLSAAPMSPSASSAPGANASGSGGASGSMGTSDGSLRPSGTGSSGGKKFPAGPLQLYLNVKMCIFSVGEATDLLFSLYSSREARFVTEDYSLALSDQGLPLNLALLHKMRTVFGDLSAADLEQDLWLVCRIYRRGRLVFDTAKNKAPSRLYRRPFGCAACSLTDSNIDAMIGREYEPPNAAMTIYTCADESKFSRLHELIVAREHRSLEPAPRAKGIALGLVLYTGELDAVRRANTDTMDPQSCPVSRKLCFPLRMSPGDARNDLYVHLLSSSFQQDNKKSAKNIEMALRVVCDDGTSVDKCISHGSADDAPATEYHSAVYYHNNSPFFNETVRLSIPSHLVERCHLFASFWHVSTSKKISCFSFAFLPLTTQHGSIVADAEYKLNTYKPFPKIEAGPAGAGSCFYLAGDAAKPKLESRKEFLVVRTQSLSTVQTQNLVLHTVLKHARADPSSIRGLMDRFIGAMGPSNLDELARFMRETLDTLLTMLATPAYARDADAIFRAIMHALCLLGDANSTLVGGANTAPMLDEYIDTLFTNPKHAFAFGSLHPTLARLASSLMQQATATATTTTAVPPLPRAAGSPPPPPPSVGGAPASAAVGDSALLKLTKSLHYVLRLILRSREIEVRAGSATAPRDHDAFKRCLADLLEQLNKMVGTPSATTSASANARDLPLLLAAQGFVVRSFPQAIGDLLGVFSPSELGAVARELILAVPRSQLQAQSPSSSSPSSSSTVDSLQSLHQLLLLRSILRSPLGSSPLARGILYPVAIQALQARLMSIDGGGLSEPVVCVDILNHMLDVVGKLQLEAAAAAAGGTAAAPAEGGKDSEMVQQFVPLLQPIVHVVLTIQRNAVADGAGSGPASGAVAVATSAAAGGAGTVPAPAVPLRAPIDAVLQLIQLDVAVDSITVLWTLLSLLSSEQIEAFIIGLSSSSSPASSSSSSVDRSPLLSFLGDFLSVCSHSLRARCYPDMWIVMNMCECSLMTKMTAIMGRHIVQHCIRANKGAAQAHAAESSNSGGALLSHTPAQQVVRAYFSLILDLLMYEQLQVELFPPRKKLFVAARYGDVRAAIIQHFHTVWGALGDAKMDYIDQFLIVKLFDLARGGVPAPTAAVASTAPVAATPKAGAALPLVQNPDDEGHASREFALNVYFDMIVSSYNIQRASVGGSGSGGAASASSADLFSQVERHTIDALYSLANLNQDAGRTLMALLYASLSARFAPCSSPSSSSSSSSSSVLDASLRSAGVEYLAHIARMYELMSSLLQFADTPLFEDERTSVAIKLMQYLESTSKGQRKEMYSKYVQYLVDLHLSLKNFTEAGCTSMQAIRMLSWSDAPLGSLDSTLTSYPAERERDRKEKLYAAAIGYFRAGEDWERAIAYGEELRLYYQFAAFDFLKLSLLLQEQSECFRSIVTTDRFYSNYFRVVHFGDGFDDDLSGGLAASSGVGKEFVYRGVKLESITDFTGRIKRKWPEAKILMSSDRPTDELMAAHRQIISITTLTRATAAESRETLAALGIQRNGSGSGIDAVAASLSLLGGAGGGSNGCGGPSFPVHADPPKNVLTYRDHNDLSVFVYAKGNQRDKKHPNEFRHLWVSKSLLVTAEAFPSNRRRQEVVARRETLLSPIANAIATMRAKNAELRDKVATVASAPPGPVDVGPLSMNLNGMIDAAVNGGTQKYIEAFLSSQYLSENESELELARAQQAELKASIVEQIADLKVALDLFGIRCDEKLRGLYDHLRGFYEQMKVKTQSVV